MVRCLLFAVLCSVVLWSGAWAKEADAPAFTEIIADDHKSAGDSASDAPRKLVKEGPDDEFDRGVPRRAVTGFFRAVREDDFERAAHYLDLRNLPSGLSVADGPELARQLKVVLDRALWVEMDLLSTSPEGHSDDGLPSYRDLVGEVEANGRKYDILLQHIPRSDGIFVWVFSSKTVSIIPLLYEARGYGPLGEKLVTLLPDWKFFGMELWQWVLLLLMIALAAAIMVPVCFLLGWAIRRRHTDMAVLVAAFVRGPLCLLLIVGSVRVNFDILRPSLATQAFVNGGTLYYLVILWVLIRLVGLFREYWSSKLLARGREQSVVLLRPLLTAFNILLVFVVLVVWLDNIGFSVTTVLAGLGIGGIALALATQKSIENFIGALTLYLAAPVRVGDFCKIGSRTGTVEEIGLRATKIRTLENTLVIVTNAELSNLQIENISQRQRFRFHRHLPLHCHTSPDQMRCVVRELRKLLCAHEMVAAAPLRVNFTGFVDYALQVELHCYIETTDINVYKSVVEDIQLRVMDILAAAGTGFGIPARMEYQSGAPEPDAEARQRAEQTVEELRRSGETTTVLSDEEIAKLENTLKFPH